MSAALDLHLSDAEREVYDRTRALGSEVLAPVAAGGDTTHPPRINRPLVRALAEHGLLDRLFAGEEVSAIELCLIREALARGCTEAETAFALQGLGAYPILQAGSWELRDEWIPRVASGEAVAAFALTEPGAGSDPAALQLRAEPDPNPAHPSGYRLTGEKLWISNAPEADIYTVFARTDPDARGARGLTAFAVPGDAPGLSGEPRALLAPHAIGSLRFPGVFAGAGQVLGTPGDGLRVAMRTLDLFRPSVGAFGIGMARTALELATSYALDRRTFGLPGAEHQAVAHRLADLRAQTEAARLLVHQAARGPAPGAAEPSRAGRGTPFCTPGAPTG